MAKRDFAFGKENFILIAVAVARLTETAADYAARPAAPQMIQTEKNSASIFTPVKKNSTAERTTG